MKHEEMVSRILEMGAQHAAVVPMEKVRFEKAFREMCASNACGMYGKSWMCPPYVGEPEELIARAKGYQYILVYQTIGELEDSYDFEGMMEAGQKMNDLTQRVRDELKDEISKDTLLLGAGGCRLCPVCAKREEKPCRFPDKGQVHKGLVRRAVAGVAGGVRHRDPAAAETCVVHAPVVVVPLVVDAHYGELPAGRVGREAAQDNLHVLPYLADGVREAEIEPCPVRTDDTGMGGT